MKAVIASSNAKKLKELQGLMSGFGWSLAAQSEFGLVTPEETGLTFVENALLKARYAAAETGLAAVADDSGLVVPALGGAPGLYSSRYAGEDGNDAKNNALLLKNLQGITDRSAYFISVVVLLRHANDPAPIVAEGRWHGHVADAPRGEHGFGYDPLFVVDDEGTRAAELSAEAKGAISHRGIAMASLRAQLQAAAH
ncbi:MAG: RdgB/HAM1 family non-canonical purine NTP pyrophosphatase [Gammaproteobacteria bacterium]|nr:RdgB/HAM1 family non-canonical purine NTP pyrophosphatase [Gammaproteobacteria bacterium]